MDVSQQHDIDLLGSVSGRCERLGKSPATRSVLGTRLATDHPETALDLLMPWHHSALA